MRFRLRAGEGNDGRYDDSYGERYEARYDEGTIGSNIVPAGREVGGRLLHTCPPGGRHGVLFGVGRLFQADVVAGLADVAFELESDVVQAEVLVQG